MPKNFRPDEIKSILESGNFDGLIGAIEDEWLECKTAPYQLEHDLQKQELAKDVSALANAAGGMILIGVKTERNPTHFGDEIKGVHPFPQTLINPNQYQDILRSWIYPTLQQVDIRWFPSAVNPEKGIMAIHIPNQTAARRPFLVTKTIDDKSKRIEVVFGYVERRRANATPMSVQELQALIRDGIRFDSLNQQNERIQEMLQYLLAQQAEGVKLAPQRDIQNFLHERIDEALTEAGLQHGFVFILAAIPVQPVEIPTLFERRDVAIVRLLEKPPELRPLGFDLYTGASPGIVRGQLRRAISRGYKILDLWRDGTLIFAAAGNGNFLCWGQHSQGSRSLRINQLVLIESTYLFTELSKQVFAQVEPQPSEIEYRLDLRNMTVDDMACGLIPGPLGMFAWGFGGDIHSAPDSNATITRRENDPEPNAVAFELVAELYAWFGIERDQIPYTEKKDGRLVISPDLIRRVSGRI